MLESTVRNICPFVPAKDFETSTRFYKELGFSCPDECEEVRFFQLGDHGFLLQDFWVEDWAANFMMNLHVEDIRGWHKHLASSGIFERYEDTWFGEPKLEDWGMWVMHFTDPTGVLWHVTMKPEPT